MDCKKFNFCDHPTCRKDNCVDCENEGPDCVKRCLDCEETYCAEHRMKDHIKYGEDESYCSDCNERATSQLESCNESFEHWVKELEERYGIKNVSQSPVVEDFSDALQARELLRQRCNAVGNKLSFKQKQWERFDSKYKHYESDLTW